MHIHLSTPCLNVALSMNERWSKGWAYFHFMVWNMWTQHKLVDFHGPVTLLQFFFFWFHYFFLFKKINLTLKMLQICSEATKLIFNISKCICFFYSDLVFFFFFIIYVQNYPKLSYIKHHKIIRASHGQLTNNNNNK